MGNHRERALAVVVHGCDNMTHLALSGSSKTPARGVRPYAYVGYVIRSRWSVFKSLVSHWFLFRLS